jgi:hypothetical protein
MHVPSPFNLSHFFQFLAIPSKPAMERKVQPAEPCNPKLSQYLPAASHFHLLERNLRALLECAHM